ncbi:hypothetical protein KJ969_02450 [Patescibacteria group bacterium]|nr:hypothetical protein [Patescibacteria group bacterium]MBU1921646.1 hypothetical protein [Patescibacteria group bacterium]
MLVSILNFFNVLNQNIGVITLAVGGFAIYLYLKQRRDYKRDAAALILQEIRYAEQQVANARSSSQGEEEYPLSVKLLPTNSWYKNIHLFVNDFKQPQIDAISRFYADVEYIDLIIKTISDYKTSIVEESIFDQQGVRVKGESIVSERVYLKNINDRLMQLQKFYQEKITQNSQPTLPPILQTRNY